MTLISYHCHHRCLVAVRPSEVLPLCAPFFVFCFVPTACQPGRFFNIQKDVCVRLSVWMRVAECMLPYFSGSGGRIPGCLLLKVQLVARLVGPLVRQSVGRSIGHWQLITSVGCAEIEFISY